LKEYDHTKNTRSIQKKPEMKKKKGKIWNTGGLGFLTPKKRYKPIILKTVKIKPQMKKHKRDKFYFHLNV
jgi:hypothetical protein